MPSFDARRHAPCFAAADDAATYIAAGHCLFAVAATRFAEMLSAADTPYVARCLRHYALMFRHAYALFSLADAVTMRRHDFRAPLPRCHVDKVMMPRFSPLYYLCAQRIYDA